MNLKKKSKKKEPFVTPAELVVVLREMVGVLEALPPETEVRMDTGTPPIRTILVSKDEEARDILEPPSPRSEVLRLVYKARELDGGQVRGLGLWKKGEEGHKEVVQPEWERGH